MVTIQMYITDKLETETSKELAENLGISISMLSAYKKSYNPSLSVALAVYNKEGLVLHPFSEESLKYEQGKIK